MQAHGFAFFIDDRLSMQFAFKSVDDFDWAASGLIVRLPSNHEFVMLVFVVQDRMQARRESHDQFAVLDGHDFTAEGFPIVHSEFGDLDERIDFDIQDGHGRGPIGGHKGGWGLELNPAPS